MSLVVYSRRKGFATCAMALLMADCGQDERPSDGDGEAGIEGWVGSHKLPPEDLMGIGLIRVPALSCGSSGGEHGSGDGGTEAGGGAGDGLSSDGGSTGGDGAIASAGEDVGAGGSAGAESEPHGCGTPLVVTQTTVLAGTNFAADFADGIDFRGAGCARAGAVSPDAVFSVQVPAGATVILRETAREYSIDPVIGFARGCSNTVECVASSAAYDVNSWLGVNYTAEEDETITAFVSSERNHSAPYRISVEYPESLGVVAAGASLPVRGGDALAADDWQTFSVDVTEPVVLYGDLKSVDAVGDLDFRAFGGNVYFSASFERGDESVAFAVPAGRHFIEVRAYDAVNGYTLNLFTDPSGAVTDPLDLTNNSEHLHEESAAIPAGRSLFYRITVLEDAALRIKVEANGGDPALSLYETSGQHFRTWQDSQGADEFLVARVSASPASPAVVVLRVQAMSEAGDIASHRIQFSVAEE